MAKMREVGSDVKEIWALAQDLEKPADVKSKQ